MAVIGVDGGGSKIVVRVARDDGAALSECVHEACGNHQITGVQSAVHAIHGAMRDAIGQAGITDSEIRSVCLGLAGADHEWDRSLLQDAFHDVHGLPVEPLIVCDTISGLRLASRDLVGVVLVCGSGTNAFGRDEQGQECQIGGFGYLFGDYGGGYHLSAEVARAVFRSEEGRSPQTRLTDLMLARLEFPDVLSLKRAWLQENRQTPPVHLAELLFEAAADGDDAANQILIRAGSELGQAARAVIRRLSFSLPPIAIVGIGAVIQYGRGPLLEALKRDVRTEFEDVRFVIPTAKPVEGSVLLALDNLSR
ncbi:MAG: N-acetylglucosamine kinase [Bacilli bacterium]